MRQVADDALVVLTTMITNAVRLPILRSRHTVYIMCSPRSIYDQGLELTFVIDIRWHRGYRSPVPDRSARARAAKRRSRQRRFRCDPDPRAQQEEPLQRR